MKDDDSVLIEFESATAGYAEELDDDRIVDYSLNPGKPIGVCLHNVDDGVKIKGLPNEDLVRSILNALDVECR
ncbi:MAG: hypothetical protein OXE43_11615 [Chloroflexi bacterium]|nr:hypothetical protein [Chloroflexota bacterium]